MLVALLALVVITDSTAASRFAVRVDAARHEVVLSIGPYDLPASNYAAGGSDVPLVNFAWPASGWARGFRVRIRDASGGTHSVRMLHHLNLVNLDRRQLVQPVYERVLALGQETGDAALPRSIGVRLDAGTPMALHMAWVNETGKNLGGVVLELTIPYLPENTSPRPREVRPLVFDVGFGPGMSNVFDLDTGRTVHKREFVVPVNGRLLGVGGHLHRFAESMELVEVSSGKVLVSLAPQVGTRGEIVAVGRQLFGVSGEGLKLRAGQRYRVIAVYRNAGGRTLRGAGMAVMAGIFAPDNGAAWPGLDRKDAALLADVALLGRKVSGQGGHGPGHQPDH